MTQEGYNKEIKRARYNWEINLKLVQIEFLLDNHPSLLDFVLLQAKNQDDVDAAYDQVCKDVFGSAKELEND